MMLDEIATLLRRKDEIGRRSTAALTMNMAGYDRWIADALELLLVRASAEEAGEKKPWRTPSPPPT